MLELTGKYNTAKVFTNNVEETAVAQIIELCNQEFVKDSTIRIMPDTHAGAGCTIGTTMTITDKIVSNLVGVDIGCGMHVTKIAEDKTQINFDQLDEVIRKHVPHGFGVRSKEHPNIAKVPLKDIQSPINMERVLKSMGTLGGGNHFIELNEDEHGAIYMVIHSGSRNLGKTVAEYYQNLAYEELVNVKKEKQALIMKLKFEGREADIQQELKNIATPKVKKELAWLEGDSFKRYMNDMKIAQLYAKFNREAMSQEVVSRMNWKVTDSFTTIHNYIDTSDMILRKGAVSAKLGERVIIPINMRDGSIIAYGKGNPDWNYSGPHGAGRLMSRSKAKAAVNIDDFKETMKDVWSTSVTESTLDESPFAYKPIEEILSNVNDSLDISMIIKPLYNFKSN